MADDLERVTDRVYRVRDRFVNLYVVDGPRLSLVDAGTKRAEPRIAAAVRELGRDIHDIGTIALTHHHLDHVGTASVWKRVADADVLVHEADAAVVAGDERRRGTAVGPRARLLVAFVGAFQRMYAAPPVRPDRTLVGGETFEASGLSVEAVHVPGHTLGSCAFRIREEGVLFTGDAAFEREGRAQPPWYVEDEAAARASFEAIAAIEARVVCPGHGNPIVRV